MQFPNMMYRSPGTLKRPGGGTYKIIGVQSQKEFDAKIANGWFASSIEAVVAAGDKATPPKRPRPKWALKKVKKRKPSRPLGWKKAAVVAAPVDNSPPTRIELETKAKELGIKFDGRTSDRKLDKSIQDRIAGG